MDKQSLSSLDDSGQVLERCAPLAAQILKNLMQMPYCIRAFSHWSFGHGPMSMRQIETERAPLRRARILCLTFESA